VLDACTSVGVRKVVFAASGGTLYGEPDPGALPISEAAISVGEPLSPYGITKKAALSYLRFYATVRGLDFSALALGNVFGPRQDPLGEAGVVAIFAKRLLSGEAPIVFGDGEQTRDYVFVDDVVDAFARASDRASGEVLNIGTGMETSVNDIFTGLASAVGWTGEPEHGPLPDGELRRICLDSSRAAQQLGWRASTRLVDGLRLTVEQMKAAG
jgi:UDP-glucose 4-epimerase